MAAAADVRTALHTLMARGAGAVLPDRDFNALALHAFAHQYARNEPYRRYCDRRQRTPANVFHWHEIPAVPTAAFKEVALVAGAAGDAALVFRTSGTTRGAERRGTHYILDATLYGHSLLASFRHYVLQDRTRMRLLSLIPPSSELPDSSLSYMVTQLLHECGTERSRSFASARSGLDTGHLCSALADAQANGEPVCLLGTSLAYAHFLAAARTRFTLQAGSRLMDTGGFKGVQREIAPDDLRRQYSTAFGIQPELCINEYGMTELCSQYYDTRVISYDGRRAAVKQGPPWLAFRVVDPDTLAPVPRGSTGILQHFDLANLDSVSAIQTEDLAVEFEGGFVLLGRVPGATPRGCSIAMDLLLSDTRGS